MTEEQHELCYEIQLILIKAITQMDHDKLWELVEKVVTQEVAK